jgi:hypothetical protein
MTAGPVAAVIPAASRGRLPQGKPSAGRPMPLASLPGRPDVVYGFGRIDASGRVADRVTMTVPSTATSRQAVVDAALVLLEQMGLTPADISAPWTTG